MRPSRQLRSTIASLGIVVLTLALRGQSAGASGLARHSPPRVLNAVAFKGLTNTALGGATLTLAPDQSSMGVCCCAGTLEECGFTTALRQGATGLGLAWNNLTLPESKAGDQLISVMRGVVAGVPGSVIGTLTISIQASTIYLVEDFSPVAAVTESIEVRSGGVTVYKAQHPNAQLVSMVFPPGPNVRAAGGNQVLIRESPTLASTGTRCEKGPKDVQSLRFSTNQTFEIAGALVSGNDIRFIRDSGGPVGGFTDVDTRIVNASGQSGQLTVGNEVLSFPDTVRYQGLLHAALGTAKLEIAPDGGTLTVNNIGSSGQDGVSIDIGRAQGMRAAIEVTPAAIPAGAYMESRSFTSGGGLPHQPAGTLRIQRVSDGFVITPDFAIPGAPTYTAFAYSGGTLLYSAGGLSGGAIHLGNSGNPAAQGTITVDCNWKKNVWTISWDFPICGILAIAGHPTASTSVVMTPDVTTPEIELDDVHMVASGMPQFVVHQESIQMFDLPITALGEAHYEFPLAERKLVASNIGSSGQDGVSVDLGRAASANVLLGDVDPGFTLDSYLQAEVFGVLDNVPGQSLGTLRVTRIAGSLGDGYAMDTNLGPLGASTVHIRVLNNHVLVADIPGHSNAIGSSTLWPKKIGKLGGTTECFVACHPAGNLYFIDGAVYFGDEIQMLAEGSTHTAGYREKVVLSGNVTLVHGPVLLDAPAPGTSAFTITGVEGEFLPTLEVPDPNRRVTAFRLDPVWPNPSHGYSTMRLALPVSGQLDVAVYDIGGRLVHELARGAFGPGERVVTWNGVGRDGRRAPGGVYFVRARLAGAASVERRIVLID